MANAVGRRDGHPDGAQHGEELVHPRTVRAGEDHADPARIQQQVHQPAGAVQPAPHPVVGTPGPLEKGAEMVQLHAGELALGRAAAEVEQRPGVRAELDQLDRLLHADVDRQHGAVGLRTGRTGVALGTRRWCRSSDIRHKSADARRPARSARPGIPARCGPEPARDPTSDRRAAWRRPRPGSARRLPGWPRQPADRRPPGWAAAWARRSGRGTGRPVRRRLRQAACAATRPAAPSPARRRQ